MKFRVISIILTIVMCTALFSGCKKQKQVVSTWEEWEEVVENSTTTDTTDKSESSTGNNSSGSKTESLYTPTDVPPVAESSLFPKDWVTSRETYEKKNNPYNVPKNLKGKTVTFAFWQDPADPSNELSDAWNTFEKATGIKLKWIEVPQADYISKLASMVASNTAPDIFVENNTLPISLKVAKPLSDVKTFDFNDPIWDQSVLKYTTFGGKSYFINTRYSFMTGGESIFYNKRVFEDVGMLTPQDYIDKGQWNMDNFMKILDEFKKANPKCVPVATDAYPLFGAYGTGISMLKNGKFVTSIDDPNFTKGFNVYFELKAKQYLGNGNAKSLIDGNLAFRITGTTGLKSNGYFKTMDPDDLGVAPLPADSSANAKTPALFRAYGICSGSKNPEAAAYALRYLLDPYNYDYKEIFLSDDLGRYFINNIAGLTTDQKSFDYFEGTAMLYGYSFDDKTQWSKNLKAVNGEQFNTTLQTWSNEIKSGVKKANDLINEVVALNK